MHPRLALVAAAVAPLALPAGANAAATLAPDHRCYGPAERVVLRGAGFLPNGNVELLENGLPLTSGAAGPTGAFFYPFTVGPTFAPRGETRRSYTATSTANRSVTATTFVRYTALEVSVRPTGGRPQSRRRIGARGFTRAHTLYAHVRRGHFRRNIRIGRLHAPCGTLRARKSLFRPGTHPGTYRVVFNGSRRNAAVRPSVSFPHVVIFRRTR